MLNKYLAGLAANGTHPRMKNRMKIGSHGFDVTHCRLMAHLGPDKFYWTLRVFAKGTLAGKSVEPSACSENLLSLFNQRLKSWQQVLEAPITWDACYNPIHERAEASLFVYSYEDIERSTLTLKPKGPTTFELHWTGSADVSSEEFDDNDDLQIEIQADGSFDGVRVCGLSESEALPILKEHLTEDAFQFNALLPDVSLLYTLIV